MSKTNIPGLPGVCAEDFIGKFADPEVERADKTIESPFSWEERYRRIANALEVVILERNAYQKRYYKLKYEHDKLLKELESR